MLEELPRRPGSAVAHLLPESWAEMHATAPIPVKPGNTCVFYSRYSSEDQKESSIERQETGCEAYARLNGLVPLEDGYKYADRERSGYYLEGRDALAELRELARKGGRGFDKLILEHLDRLSRNIVHVLMIYEELKALGIEIHVTSCGIGRVDDVHVVFYGLIGMEQRTRMLRLTSQGAWQAALAGRNIGCAPYGYRYGDTTGELVVFEEEAIVVERIFRLFVAGVAPVDIARLLNDEGKLSPGGSFWTRNAIAGTPAWGSGILRNPKYIGVLVWGRSERIKLADRPSRKSRIRSSTLWVYGEKPEWKIVDPAVWMRALCRLKEAGRNGTRSVPREKSSGRATLLFHGSYRCICGSTVASTFRSSSSARTMKCVAAETGGLCERSRSMSSNYVEGEILRALRDNLLSSVDLPGYIDEYRGEVQQFKRDMSERADDLRRRIVEIDLWFAASLDKSLTRGVPREDVELARAAKEKQRADHRLALAALPAVSELASFDPRLVSSLKDEVDALIRRLPIVAGSETELSLVQTLRRLVGKVVIDLTPGEGSYSLEITFAPAMLVAPAGTSAPNGLESVTVRRVCESPKLRRLAAEEREADLRMKVARMEFALTDEDWRIVAPILEGSLLIDERLAMNAVLLYLRSAGGFEALPPPYGGSAMRYQAWRLVSRGYLRRAYLALLEAGSSTVRDLDISRLTGMENHRRVTRSTAV